MSEAPVCGPIRRPSGGLRAVLSVALVATFAMAGCSSDSDADSSTSIPAAAGSAPTPGSLDGTSGSTPADPAASSSSDPVSTASSVAPPDGGEVTTTTAAPTTTTIAPTTTTTIALVTEGALVLVANAAGVPGAAGRMTQALQAVGYSMKEPTDAAGYEESLDASKIYFRPEAEATALSLAAVMQINSTGRMPTPAPIVDAQVGLADATILIMLGRDLADAEIPGFAGR